jgi:Cytidylate kinase-like family
MSRSVVCISRATGAGGEEIARLAADQLGFRLVDDEVVARAAELAGVSPDEVAQIEHSKALVARVLAAIDAATSVPKYTAPSPEVRYSHLIVRALGQIAEAGNVVIVAHGASHAFGTPDVLRVLVTASPRNRAARLSRGTAIDERSAAKQVAASDKERARYLDRIYGLKHELPVQYDLTLNTDNLTPATAAALIAAAARA